MGAERAGDLVGAATRFSPHTIRSFGRGFRRFITVLLPEEARTKLMESIAIERRVAPPLVKESEPSVDLDDAKKIEWLFEVRNQYTHLGAYVPGLHPDQVPSDLRGGWWWMADIATPATITEYPVQDWLPALDQAVRAGLVAFAKRIPPGRQQP